MSILIELELAGARIARAALRVAQREKALAIDTQVEFIAALAQVALAVLTALALLTLVGAVPQGLLGLPDMHVAGNGSGAWNLRWFADQSAGALPRAGVFSVSLWVYKLAMLAWALWLANALIGWLRWAFGAWSEGGYWRRPVPAATPPGLPSTRSGDGASHD